MKNLVANGKSLMKIKNSRGPNMDPWGTPYKISRREEEVLLSLTNWWRLERYDLKSTAKNCAYLDFDLQGKVLGTFNNGLLTTNT